MSAGSIDLGLARRVAGLIGSEPQRPAPGAAEVGEAVAAAAEAAAAYASLADASRVPDPHGVDRSGWVEANLPSIEALGRRIDRRLDSPGQLGALAARPFSLIAGAQAGVALGYASTRVLGQYRVPLLGEDAEPRLMIVSSNIEPTAERLGIDPGELLRWVAAHEVTHVLQFEAAGWLVSHIGELIDEVLASARPQLDGDQLRRLIGVLVPPDPRRIVRALSELEPVELLAGAEGRRAFGRVQATMSLIEGHAEHVMDAAAAELVNDVGALRARLDERRSQLSPPAAVLARLLGLSAKARQYREGRAFVEAVVDAAGIEALNRAFARPECLPSPEELADAERWLERTSPPRGAALS